MNNLSKSDLELILKALDHYLSTAWYDERTRIEYSSIYGQLLKNYSDLYDIALPDVRKVIAI